MPTKPFKLASFHSPVGDQPRAIEALCSGIDAGRKYQTLLGVTGSGKTFTIANTIARLNRPTIVMAPNKTLAAQLYGEFKKFFPDNAVEYFVSFYDYYQPEAYIPRTDTFIEKDLQINERIDRMRHSATRSLLDRQDVVIVASVSCIFGLGSPEAYAGALVYAEKGAHYPFRNLLFKLVEIAYSRNDYDLKPGTFRVKGDTVDIHPMYEDGKIVRIEYFGDQIDNILEIDPLTGEIFGELDKVTVYPATHYVTPRDKIHAACDAIRGELAETLLRFQSQGKLLEAQRIEQRTKFDLEALEQTGTCFGVENYSRHMEGRATGSKPPTLMDYLPKNALIVLDESHITIPQIGGMYRGDRARKETLVEYGFRLPSALDNRPLRFDEFEAIDRPTIYVSATPGDYELKRCGVNVSLYARKDGQAGKATKAPRHQGDTKAAFGNQQLDDVLPSPGGEPVRADANVTALAAFANTTIVQQIIRPTGLVDPQIEIRPAKGQVDDLLEQIRVTVKRGDRVLVCTLTKRMAEELTEYYDELGLNVRYLHSEIDTIERTELLRGLRKGEFDILVGINLLREGLDLPEVALIAILDADKEGYLRSARSLIQIVGRAARNVHGRVVFYADAITGSMQQCIEETDRRRAIQVAYNKANNITPKTVISALPDTLHEISDGDFSAPSLNEPAIRDAVLKAAERGATGRSARHIAKQSKKKLYDKESADKLLADLIPEQFRDRELDLHELPKLISHLNKEMALAAKNLEFEKAAMIRDEVRELQRLELEVR